MKNLKLSIFLGLLFCLVSLPLSAQTPLSLPLNITSNDQLFSRSESGTAKASVSGTNQISFIKDGTKTGSSSAVIWIGDVPGRLKMSVGKDGSVCTSHTNSLTVYASSDNSSYRQLGSFNHKDGTVEFDQPLNKDDRYIRFYYDVTASGFLGLNYCAHGWIPTIVITEPISFSSSTVAETVIGGMTFTGKFTVNYSNPAGDITLISSDPEVVLQTTRIENVAGQEGSREITYTYTPSAVGLKQVNITVTDEGNGTYSKILGLDLTTNLPAAPSLDGIDSSIGLTSFNAVWQSVDNASAYLLTVTDAEGNIINEYDNFAVEGTTSVGITGLVPNTLYKYFVKTQIGNFISEASAIKEIETLKPLIAALSVDAYTTVAGVPSLQTLAVSASDLYADITVEISGNNATLFTLGEGEDIIGKDVDSKQLNITYSPVEPGIHTAVLTLTSEYAEPVTVTLNGTANPAPASNLEAVSITPVGFTANWGAVAGATSYELTVTTSEGVAVDGYTAKDMGMATSCEITGLDAATTYIFTVVVKSDALVSSEAVSKEVATLTVPVIDALTIEPYSSVVGTPVLQALTINASDLYGDIAVEISGNNATLFTLGEGEEIIGKDIDSKQLNITYSPVEPGIHTAVLTLTSKYAEPVTVTLNGSATLSAPAELTATEITPAGFTANWNAVAGAGSYELSVTTSEGAAVDGYTAKNVEGETSCQITGLNSATAYIFKVVAKKGESISLENISETVTTLAAPVINTPVIPVFETEVSVSTEQKITILSSDLYSDIIVSITGKDADKFSTDVTILDKSDIKQITVTYMSDEAGEHMATLSLTSEYAEPVNVALNGTSLLAKPVVIVGDALESEIPVSWNAVAGAAEYRVTLYKGETPVKEYENVVTDETCFTFTGLMGSTQYFVVVTAVSGEYFANSEKVAVTTVPTGIATASTDVVTVYPNPAVSDLYIKGAIAEEVNIYSVSGKFYISARPENNKVDVSSLAPGIYTILIKSDKGIAHLQFIKK